MTHLRRVMGFWDLVLFYVVTTFSIRWIATDLLGRHVWERADDETGLDDVGRGHRAG